ncbi:NAD-dependent epimerase/dehydratase family protein [Seonamhaeicola maritimus]|uniref:NAD-dependent epimerase/dehydratase family protein n=1 Tax=Seonamhaeicola maritimus TaxID=2591822 RepID=A0A5C7GEK8_9FLAO|nr:NAD-dependent epimerase/dehydratase family protein [Seonamhaeicola maritimus]TXG35283.1 NAD-dependent epimerase/dehydratase family protein [Seonamhaeicola maritimus]
MILVIGANGQLGTVLTQALRGSYGADKVVASDIMKRESNTGLFEVIDATNFKRIEEVVKQYKVTEIYHLAAILSANAESNRIRSWEINTKTLLNVLEVSRLNKVEKVFYPSSIAVFGKNAPRIKTPNNVSLNPETVYGISKVDGENWGQYYYNKYDLDVRSIRYPGVISYQSLPGGGTTDYAVDIYHKAVLNEKYSCYLTKDTTLPMIFIDDVIRATLQLMEASKEQINIRTSYNVSGLSFSPEEVAKEIRKRISNFEIEYIPDFRQEIAANWPVSIDDSCAYNDWGWQSEYNLSDITKVMLSKLRNQYKTLI